MKKFVAMFLALLFAISLLSGCTKADAPAESASEGEAASDAAQEPFDVKSLKTFQDVRNLLAEGKADDKGLITTDEYHQQAIKVDGVVYRLTGAMTAEDFQTYMDLSYEDPEREAKEAAIIDPIVITKYEDMSAAAPTQEDVQQQIGKTGAELFDGEWSYWYYMLDTMEYGITNGAWGYKVTFEMPATPYENTDDFDAYAAVSNLKVVSIVREEGMDDYTAEGSVGVEIK